ncbi:HEAT repeat domain-containing protein [Embleya sp. NBC_00888]|uniref:NACHT domain-containing protein n=1 Tax=Embleya sp. NBC_00888 TaxID=2975960 RepID=UPI00386CE8CB|nr:HEAT repeat domain-containing protein [Embleya sp. NBC_00888]
MGLAPSSICEWLSGTSVPKDPVAFAFLIARLEARARPRSPGFRFRTGRQWESLRLEARAERRGGGSRGGVTGASTATSPSARLSAPSDHEVAEAVTRYARRVVEEFGGLDLEVLTPFGDEHPAVRLPEVFVAPTVRADPPPVELPRELSRRLTESGGLLADEFLPPGFDAGASERMWTSYAQRPQECVLEVLVGAAGRRVVLLGDPGAGKSTLVRYLALSLTCGEPDRALSGLAGVVPMVVELRRFVDERARYGGYEEFLDRQHHDFGLCVPAAVRERLLVEGRAVVAFDGLDEVFDPRARVEACRRVAAFAARWPAARILVTSRSVGYQSALLAGAGFAHFKVQDLDEERIKEFTRSWYRSTCPNDPGLVAELVDRLDSALEGSRPLQEMAGNPLLLTILAIIGRRQPLPRNRRGVYEHAVTVLVARWDQAAKMLKAPLPAAVAEALDVLGAEERLELLRGLARTMQEGLGGIVGNHIHASDLERVFCEYLQQYELPPVHAKAAARAMIAQLHERNFILSRYGGDVYGFVHRAFLEYLAAADIVHRFKEEREWTPEELIEQVVVRRVPDPAWHEILLLLIGQLNARDTTAVVDRLMGLHARRVDSDDAGHAVLALRALAEVGKSGTVSMRGAGVVDAVTTILNTRGSKGEWLLSEASSALASFDRRWAGRKRYLRWYRLSGQFSSSEEPSAVVAWCLRPDDDELAALAQGSCFGSDRLLFLAEWGERRPDDDKVRELVLRETRHGSPGGTHALALHILGEVWAGCADVRALLVTRAAYDSGSGPVDLDDSDRGVRTAALESLVTGWPHDDDVRDLVARAASDDVHPFVRDDALRLLARGWSDDEDVRAFLIRRAREDEDDDVRGRALRTLALHGSDHEDTLAFLAGAVADDTDPVLCTAAIADLRESAWGGDDIRDLLVRRAAGSAHEEVRQTALQLLGARWPRHAGVREALVHGATGNGSAAVRSEALRTLATHWPRQDGVRDVIVRRVEEDAEDTVRRTAVDMIAACCPGHDDVRDVLIRAADDESYRSARDRAREALAEHWADQPEVRDLLISACGDQSDGYARAAVLRHLLKHWPDHHDIHELLVASLDHPGRYTGSTTLDGLQNHWPDSDTFRAVLMRAAADDSRYAGDTAVKVLARRWADRDDVGRLVMGIASDPQHLRRDSALRALSEYWAHREDVRDVLVRALADPAGEYTRIEIVKALGLRWNNHTHVHKAFRRSAVGDPKPDLRFSTLRWWVLAAGDDEGRVLVCDRALQEPDPDTRRKVLHMLALGWPSHPRTAVVLRDRARRDEDGHVKATAEELLGMVTTYSGRW